MLTPAMAESTLAASAAITPEPVSLFYCYAHKDKRLRDELQKHLMILQRRGVIRPWVDRDIVPGEDWNQAIHDQLRQAELVLMLVSADFIASDYIMGVEYKLAMQRQDEGRATVVPVLLRDVDLADEDGPLAALLKRQGLPPEMKAVTRWSNRDSAWTAVAAGLRTAVKAIQARRAAPAKVPARSAPPQDAGSQDGLLDEVLGEVTRCAVAADRAKGGQGLDEAALRSQALRLIDLPEPRRVLWVDDHPENNAYESELLAKLQIEVDPVVSTDLALAHLADPHDAAYDLVISDWTRSAEAPLAGLRLLLAMRARGHDQPVVIYHGTFGAAPRAALALAARGAGAFGEAVLPAELMGLVQGALRA